MDLLIDCVASFEPIHQGRWQGPFARKADCAIECNPAHEARIQELPPTAAHLPDAFVRPPPIVSQPLHRTRYAQPGLPGDLLTAFVRKVQCIHQLSVDVELQLLLRCIAYANRCGATITA